MSSLVRKGYKRRPCGGKGDGVFAMQPFDVGETVMVGEFESIAEQNDTHAVQIGPGEFAYERGLVPIVNHSCEPNCGVRPGYLGIVELVARRPIAAGEEITLDYAMRNHVIEHFPRWCLCGSPNCRGRITGWKDLPDERKAEYEGFVAQFLLEIDHGERFGPVQAMSSAA